MLMAAFGRPTAHGAKAFTRSARSRTAAGDAASRFPAAATRTGTANDIVAACGPTTTTAEWTLRFLATAESAARCSSMRRVSPAACAITRPDWSTTQASMNFPRRTTGASTVTRGGEESPALGKAACTATLVASASASAFRSVNHSSTVACVVCAPPSSAVCHRLIISCRRWRTRRLTPIATAATRSTTGRARLSARGMGTFGIANQHRTIDAESEPRASGSTGLDTKEGGIRGMPPSFRAPDGGGTSSGRLPEAGQRPTVR